MSVKFPDGFIALKKYPGYFWNPSERYLYSLKVNGILTKLNKKIMTHSAYRSMMKRKILSTLLVGDEYFQISHQGKRRTIHVRNIELKLDYNHIIPIKGD